MGSPGLISILGGKLTTHRSLAEEAVDAACELLGRKLACRSGSDLELGEEHPLPPMPEDALERLQSVYGPYTSNLARLIEQDPSLKQPLLPGLPLVRAEVAYAFTREAADNLDDFFNRRCMLTTENLPWARHARPLALAVGGILGWDPARSERELQQWVHALEHHDPLNASRVKTSYKVPRRFVMRWLSVLALVSSLGCGPSFQERSVQGLHAADSIDFGPYRCPAIYGEKQMAVMDCWTGPSINPVSWLPFGWLRQMLSCGMDGV